LCTGKPFHSTNESHLIRFEQSYFRLVGEGLSSGKNYKVEVALSLEGTKQIKLNGSSGRLSELLEVFPVVAITPDEISLIFGSPSLRRRFLDSAMSQLHPAYLNTLLEYQKVLDQRNRALKEDRGSESQSYKAWDEQLVQLGSEIVKKRIEFLDQIRPEVEKHYAQISGEKEKVSLEYKCSFYFSAKEEIAQQFSAGLKTFESREKILAATLVGPHRDDLEFKIDGNLAREYGSFGQGRTALLSLKLGQLDLLRNNLGEPPLLLLDEVFSDLDERRSEYLGNVLSGAGQVFIATSKEWELPEKLKQGKIFEVKNGKMALRNSG
jgi:DNA replication and repair protein RecF